MAQVSISSRSMRQISSPVFTYGITSVHGRVNVVGAQPKHVPLQFMAFDRVQGDYELADGRVLSVTGKGKGKERKLYADLGDGPVEMVHVGKNRFEGRDRNVRISFDTVGNKQPELVRVTAPTRG